MVPRVAAEGLPRPWQEMEEPTGPRHYPEKSDFQAVVPTSPRRKAWLINPRAGRGRS